MGLKCETRHNIHFKNQRWSIGTRMRDLFARFLYMNVKHRFILNLSLWWYWSLFLWQPKCLLAIICDAFVCLSLTVSDGLADCRSGAVVRRCLSVRVCDAFWLGVGHSLWRCRSQSRGIRGEWKFIPLTSTLSFWSCFTKSTEKDTEKVLACVKPNKALIWSERPIDHRCSWKHVADRR